MPDDFIDITKNAGAAKEVLSGAQRKIEALILQQAMEKALSIIEADAKRECPVKKGRLRASITHSVVVSVTEARGRVGTNVEYAPYIHEGTGIYAVGGNGRQTPWGPFRTSDGQFRYTRGMRPRPFLRLAMEKNKGRIGAIFEEAMKQLDK